MKEVLEKYCILVRQDIHSTFWHINNYTLDAYLEHFPNYCSTGEEITELKACSDYDVSVVHEYKSPEKLEMFFKSLQND